MNKLRISLTEKEEGDVKGKIEADGDSLFVFECLLEIIETLAKGARVGCPRLGPGFVRKVEMNTKSSEARAIGRHD